ncbi:MAG: sensor histidine kinase [Haliscomenobacteraceae bacterium CHB4]|nr:sensor histidine kinase [Haliscomenobacteraceae bacterium CHB4]
MGRSPKEQAQNVLKRTNFVAVNKSRWYLVAGHCLYWLLFFLFDWLATSGKVGRVESEILLKEASINFVSAAFLAYSSIYWFRANWFDGRYRRLIAGIAAFILLAGLLKHAMKTVFIYVPLLETHLSDVPSWLNFWKPKYVLGSIVSPMLQASIVVMAYFFSLWTRQQRLIEKAKREKVEAELELLKSQVEPHFIFNTLNNIYYLAQNNHPRTGEMIYRLAQLLSFMLYDSRKSMIPVEKELDYIRDYVNLERIRYGEKLDISVNVYGNLKDAMAPPLLLLPLVENAFKHGIAPVGTGWIRVDVSRRNGSLVCKVENSVPEQIQEKAQKNEASGLGLSNLESRLGALFPQQHELKTLRGKESFLSVLSIPL